MPKSAAAASPGAAAAAACMSVRTSEVIMMTLLCGHSHPKAPISAAPITD